MVRLAGCAAASGRHGLAPGRIDGVVAGHAVLGSRATQLHLHLAQAFRPFLVGANVGKVKVAVGKVHLRRPETSPTPTPPARPMAPTGPNTHWKALRAQSSKGA